jgi:hypothetical protein
MREAITRRTAVDAAAFDAALRRVVERAVAAPADDSTGARVMARLAAPAAWRPSVVPMLAAPAVVAVAVLLLFVSAPDRRSAPRSPGAAPAAMTALGHAAPTAPADAAPPEPRGADRGMIAGAAPALASSGRRRSRPRVAAATSAPDGDPSENPAASVDSSVDSPVGWYELTLPPEPLPVDRLEIVAIDAAGPAPRYDQ